MATARTYSFAFAAFALYMFANQTQVGWLYVMSALLVGILLVSYLLNRRAVHGIHGERRIGASIYGELYEDESVEVALRLKRTQRLPLFQLQITETCPPAPPDIQAQKVFVPVLAESVELLYSITLDRRGVYQFPAIQVISRAPFGFFERRAAFDVPTRILVYPVVKPLRHFDLLDKQLAAQQVYPRAGVGSEVLGTRPYRAGDSLRHIHWRSVARTGELISKEFAEETQPGVSLIFDRYFPHPNNSKHIPFEWAIKCAVSIADYTRSYHYPLYVVADNSADLPPPSGAVAWDALLQYMTRVTPLADPSLAELLTSARGLQTFVVVVISQPDLAVVEPLRRLKHQGYRVSAVVLDPESFPARGESVSGLADALRAAEINVQVIKFGTDWTTQLAGR